MNENKAKFIIENIAEGDMIVFDNSFILILRIVSVPIEYNNGFASAFSTIYYDGLKNSKIYQCSLTTFDVKSNAAIIIKKIPYNAKQIKSAMYL